MTKRKTTKPRYKTHEELGISFAEWGALFGFKAIGEAGIVLKTIPARFSDASPVTVLTEHPREHFFNMAYAGMTAECGSVGCIGATVAMFCRIPNIGQYVDQFAEDDHPLAALYYPTWNNGTAVRLRGTDRSGHNWASITVQMAAKATDNFLRTGKPNWDSIIPKSWRRRPLRLTAT